MSNDDEKPKTGDKIEVGDEVAFVLARSGSSWFVLRKSGQVRHLETGTDGVIKFCEVLWRCN
jgi:hypothetical protein